MERTFGCIKSPVVASDKIFLLNKAQPEEYNISDIPSVKDQGSRPWCAAISITDIVNWQNKIKGNNVNLSAKSLFETRSDPNMQGMIPREALVYMKENGLLNMGKFTHIKAFAKVVDINSAKAAILLNGPLMIATYAYNDSEYFWRPTNDRLGGHAVLLTGWNTEGFELQNSWGYGWANGGRTIMPYEDWNYIFEAWTILI